MIGGKVIFVNFRPFGFLSFALYCFGNPLQSISRQLSPIFIKLGLLFVGALVLMKRFLLAFLQFFGRLLSPLGRLFLRFLILPLYGVSFSLQKRMSAWYRPAKNRFMFFLSNRYSIHGVVLLVAFVAVGVNLQFGEVRAETENFGEKSLLYAIVTDQSVEVIEEYADYEVPPAVTVIGESTLRPVSDTAPASGVPASVVFGDGILSSQPVSTTEDTVAPRETVVAYTVGSGDTLSTIAEKFDITLNTLLWSNNLSVRSVIKPGDHLTILPVSGVQHTVKSGDTLTAIAKKYGVDADDIVTYNKLESSGTLSIGLHLVVPGGEFQAPAPSSTVRTVAVKDIFTAPPPGTTSPTDKPAEGKMVWPTDLVYVVRGLSWTHSGLDIDCNGHADGTSTNTNYAAADGIVQFSGTKRGYGNVVEINHGNGIVTRYGHFNTLYVKSGQQVTSGTPLGRCGSTGYSTGTHLHFEVIVNGKFKNPYDYLR